MIKRDTKRKIFIGDKFKTQCHGEIEVIYYNNANDIGVRFESGFERSANSGNIQKGKVSDPTVPPKENAKRKTKEFLIVGKEYQNTLGHKFVITKYTNASDVDIEFASGYKAKVRSQAIFNGSITDYLSPTKLGVGILGLGNFETNYRKGHESKEYKHWSAMLARCYDEAYKERFPTYRNVTVCEEWLNFQVFAEWCSKQKNSHNADFVLDKDILFKNNKHYSPDTCTFVPYKINALFTKCNSRRGDTPIGVYFAAKNQKYGACLSVDSKSTHLGFFKDKTKAFETYKKAKEKHIKDMANFFRDDITEKCYEALYNYVVEITD